MSELNTQYFLGVRVDNLRLDQARKRVERLIDDNREASGTREVFFVNVHSIFLSKKHEQLKRHINHADLVLGDGSGLAIAGKLLGNPMRDNLNGTDFIPEVLSLAARKQWSVYLLGAKEQIVQKCFRNIEKQYPGLHMAGYHNGYFNESKEQTVIKDINSAKPDILLVAMGSPLQERWIAEHKDQLCVSVSFGVGGLFDFMSGSVPRAPLWMRKLGIEWVYRFFHQPQKKWKRVFYEIPLFLPMIFFKQKLPNKLDSLLK